MKTPFVIFASVLSLAGCAGFLPPKHDGMLATASPCCTTFSALPFRDLNRGQSIRTFVGPDTPSFIFPEGKSYFLAIRPDRGSENSTLIIRTYAQNMLYNRDGHVFVPHVTLLSNRYELITSVSPEFTVQGPKYGIGESAWRVDLPLPPQAAYVVIHTTNIERNKIMRKRDHDQLGGYLYTRTGPAGEVEVELQ